MIALYARSSRLVVLMPASFASRRAVAAEGGRRATSSRVGWWGFSLPIFDKLSKVIVISNQKKLGSDHDAVQETAFLLQFGPQFDLRVHAGVDSPPQALLRARQREHNIAELDIAHDHHVNVAACGVFL